MSRGTRRCPMKKRTPLQPLSPRRIGADGFPVLTPGSAASCSLLDVSPAVSVHFIRQEWMSSQEAARHPGEPYPG